MELASLENLEKAVAGLPEPRSYFKGLASGNFELPNNLVLFQRSQSSMLRQEQHHHSRFVLIVNLRTEGVVVLDNRSLVLKPGEALVVFPHQFHHFLSPHAEAIRWLFITFELNQPDLVGSLRNRTNPLPESSFLYLSRLIGLFLERPAFGKEIGAASLLTGLLLLELMQQEGRSGGRPVATRPSIIEQINRYIWEHFDKDMKISHLAEKFPYSESHLRLLFRTRMGMSLGTYIQKVKMNRARSLLVNSSLNVSQVAQACGFDSLYAFSRAFKKSNAVSPLAYKKMNAHK